MTPRDAGGVASVQLQPSHRLAVRPDRETIAQALTAQSLIPAQVPAPLLGPAQVLSAAAQAAAAPAGPQPHVAASNSTQNHVYDDEISQPYQHYM